MGLLLFASIITQITDQLWNDAFVATEPLARLPEPSLRLRAVLAGARLAGGALGALGRLRRARPGAP